MSNGLHAQGQGPSAPVAAGQAATSAAAAGPAARGRLLPRINWPLALVVLYLAFILAHGISGSAWWRRLLREWGRGGAGLAGATRMGRTQPAAVPRAARQQHKA